MSSGAREAEEKEPPELEAAGDAPVALKAGSRPGKSKLRLAPASAQAPTRAGDRTWSVKKLVGVQLYLHGAWHAGAGSQAARLEHSALHARMRELELQLRKREAELSSVRSHVARLAQRPDAARGAGPGGGGGEAALAGGLAAATDGRLAGVPAGRAAEGRVDPCSLHWNSLLRTDAGSDAAGGGQWAGAAGGGGGAVQGGAAARQKRPLLYVGVLTRPSARDKRDALRRTWFRQGSGEWVGAFFLGRPKNDSKLAAELEEEAARECDIEFVREEEDYYSIAYKSLAVLERGSLQARAEFVLKTDDDSYVYMRRLLAELREAPRRGYFWGYDIGEFKPHRDSKSQWYMPYEEWPADEPPMRVVSGAGYVMSADVATFAARESHKPTARILRLEDVTVAALLRSAPTYAGTPVHDNRVRHLGQCTDDALILHYQKPAKIMQIEEDLRALGYPYPTCAPCDAVVNATQPPPPSGSAGRLRGGAQHHHIRVRSPSPCIRREATVCGIHEIRTVPGGGDVRARGC